MSEAKRPAETLLLTGATWFVGRHLRPALVGAGYRVRCGSRRPEEARAADPEGAWVRLDVEDPETIGPALRGCGAAVFLVHGMGSGAPDYPERERAAALAFREAAEGAGLRRLVYLGGVAPAGPPSKHLESRLETGRLLRAGSVSAVELRAGMIVGAGSASWLIVRDLARRLPAMLLPRWLRNHSWPVAIDDVVAAILLALALPGSERAVLEVPGPERISHRDLMRRVASLMGKRPLLLDIPVLSPRLSSYWIALVTRAELSLARELVQGLSSDMDPTEREVWELAPGYARLPLDAAVQRALRDEGAEPLPHPDHLEDLRALGARLGVETEDSHAP